MARKKPEATQLDMDVSRSRINTLASVSCVSGFFYGLCYAVDYDLPEYAEMVMKYGPALLGAGLFGHYNMVEVKKAVKNYEKKTLDSTEERSELEKMIDVNGTEGVVPAVTASGAIGGAFAGGVMTLVCFGVGYVTGKAIEFVIK